MTALPERTRIPWHEDERTNNIRPLNRLSSHLTDTSSPSAPSSSSSFRLLSSHLVVSSALSSSSLSLCLFLCLFLSFCFLVASRLPPAVTHLLLVHLVILCLLVSLELCDISDESGSNYWCLHEESSRYCESRQEELMMSCMNSLIYDPLITSPPWLALRLVLLAGLLVPFNGNL